MTSAVDLLPSARVLDVADPQTFELHISPRDRDRAASVPGLRYYKDTETWKGPARLSVALALRGVFGDALEVRDAAYAAVQAEADEHSVVAEVKVNPGCKEGTPGTDGLRPEQADAAFLAALRGGFLIGDEKGYGKTVEAAGALNVLGDEAFPALIIATNTMKYTWGEELERWTGRKVAVMGRTPTQRKAAIAEVQEGRASVLVCSWAQVKIHSRLAPYGSVARTDKEKEDKELNEIAWATVIADEAHAMKNPKAKQTRAAWAVRENARNRWALTATPVAGHTIDLWGVLHFCSPEDYPSRSKFIDRFVLVHENPWGGMEDLGLNPVTEEEFRRTFDALHIRRPLVRKDYELLPPQHRFVDMEGKQRSIYKKIEKEQIARVDDRFLVAVGPLVLNTRLLQLSQATPVLEEVETPDGPAVNVVAMQRPSCKYDALVDLLGEMGDEPLVVFSESRLLLEMCKRELVKDGLLREEEIGMIVGGVDPAERHRWITEFQEGRLPLILCTIGAGSEGITLTRASTMVFLNRSYRYVGNNQAEGRLDRHGQTRDVQIIDIIARESEEYRVHESSALKEARLQSVVLDPDHRPREIPKDTGVPLPPLIQKETEDALRNDNS